MSHADRTSLAASLAVLLLFAAPAAARAGDEAARSVTAADPAMPAMLRLAVARGQAADAAPAYHLDRGGRGANPRHGLELAFTPRGARIDGPAGGFALRLERFGRGDGRPVRRAVPRIDGAWVEYNRGSGLSEWFVNLPRGVEQGWTVARRPAGGGALVLELDTARPPEESDERRLAWSGLVYHRIVALDADGRELPAAWTHDGDRLRIEVDDREAAYPVLIDPWVEQAKLAADDAAAGDEFGFSLAVAGDSALVGAFGADVDGNSGQGAAYVFARSGGVWSQQAKLTAADGALGDFFGASVALASDSALVGASGADVDGTSIQGAAYVFTRSGGVWSQQAKLTAEDGAAGDTFGFSVALAGDSALVGAPFASMDGNGFQGAAYVFTRSGGVWSQQAELTADDGATGDNFSFSVALAGDSALVGALGADVDGKLEQGAAYLFTRSGGVWSQQAKLTADDGAAGDQLGYSFALAGDSALVGAIGADVDGNFDQGAAYVFTRSGGVWSQQAKLTAADGAADDNFGWSVALAGDSALVGAPIAHVGGNAVQGAAYVFTRSDGVWSQQAKLTAADGAAGDAFGVSAALASDTAFAGAPLAHVDGNVDQGAAYVFVPSLVPAALEVDPVPLASDGNGVFEPGERVEAAPAWRNDGGTDAVADGILSDFVGPSGASYDIVANGVVYGPIPPGAIGSCRDSESGCYQLEILLDGPDRPELHWDATVEETLDTDTQDFAHSWTLHVGDSFTDVPRSSPFYTSIETVLHVGVVETMLRAGVTGGCADTEFCPTSVVTRAEMPVFVLKALEGSDFAPPSCVEGAEEFADVPFDSPLCPWIEELASRQVTVGCGGGNYCPGDPVTRAQMAVFLLKPLEGGSYTPVECKGMFDDVICPSRFADWIEDLLTRGITGGCDTNPLTYCPLDPVARQQMAAFVSRTFELALYGP